MGILGVKTHPQGKFQTLLFLPEGEGRKGEGGLRTKGYFKHSYKLVGGVWYICDTEGSPVAQAPQEIQNQIIEYVNKHNATNTNPITHLPLVSVITVVFNAEKYLEETIQSVISQTYPNVEYIIIDGGSTDGTLDIIKKYEDKIDYWVSEKDNGIYDAMNKGIDVACGEWINFMNAGDRFYSPKVLEEVFTKDISGYDVLYGDTVVWYKDYGIKVAIKAPQIDNTLSHAEVFERIYRIFHQSEFVRKTADEKFDTSFPTLADRLSLLKIYFSNKAFYYTNTCIAEYLTGGFSEKKWLSAFKEKIRIMLYFKHILSIKEIIKLSINTLVVPFTRRFIRELLPARLSRKYLIYKHKNRIVKF